MLLYLFLKQFKCSRKLGSGFDAVLSAMESQLQNVTKDLQTILSLEPRASTSVNGGENTDHTIPVDHIIEILSRLPAKSIARYRCVSKLWSTIIRLPCFTELFLTKSSSRPQLLFAFHNHFELFFYSTPQPQSQNHLNENSSVVANSLSHFPIYCGNGSHNSISHIGGLLYLITQRGEKPEEFVICNPRTGQSLSLPTMNTMRRRKDQKSFFGYDQIEKQYKVLCMTLPSSGRHGGTSKEHQVLTLGTEELSWRMVECCVPHVPGRTDNEVCINGVLYYGASANMSSEISMIVCFDVRSEKFSFVKSMEKISRRRESSHTHTTTLINYNGI